MEFDIRGEDFEDPAVDFSNVVLINTNSTCENDLHVCCKKAQQSPTTPDLSIIPDKLITNTVTTTTTTRVTTTVVQKPPKCGQHNPDGLEIKAKHPSDDGNIAFERYLSTIF